MKESVHGSIAIMLALTLLAACGSEPVAPAFSTPEVFNWKGQPVSFSLPAEGWERGRAQNGGEEGVRFVKRGSVGEEIHVSERFFLGNRDRCARLQALMNDVPNLDEHEFASRLQASRLYASPALNASEARFVPAANSHLDEANRSFREGDAPRAQRAIAGALSRAKRIRYEIDEVVDRVIFSAEQITDRNVSAISEDPVSGELAGEPAISVDYTLRYSGRNYVGRRIYAVKNNHLFEVGFQGLGENIPLFEGVVGTLSFPPGECEH